MNKPVATLCLRTCDLPYTLGTISMNQVGGTNIIKTQATWNNINLRLVLGDMYDKYDKFNLMLNSVSNGFTGAAYGNNDYNQVLLKMSGLNWINANYDFKSGSTTNQAVLGAYTLAGSASGTNSTQYTGQNILTFNKQQDNVNITVGMYYVSSDTIYTAGGASYPNWSLLLRIWGVEN